MKKIIPSLALLLLAGIPIPASAHGGHQTFSDTLHVLYHSLLDTHTLIIVAVMGVLGLALSPLIKKIDSKNKK